MIEPAPDRPGVRRSGTKNLAQQACSPTTPAEPDRDKQPAAGHAECAVLRLALQPAHQEPGDAPVAVAGVTPAGGERVDEHQAAAGFAYLVAAGR
jgi:hypothetical protein